MAVDELPKERAPREPTRRLFFALWPDEAMRQAMVQATREAGRTRCGSDPGYGGRPVPAHNLHVTLAFLGSVPERRLAELGEIARAAVLKADFASLSSPGSHQKPVCESELVFDHLEYWRAAQLLCALPAEPPAPIVALARRLQDRLAVSGFAPDSKSSRSVGVSIARPFRPHVTLARKVHRPPCLLEMDPVTWRSPDFVLVDSKTLPEGSVYTVLEKFPLDR